MKIGQLVLAGGRWNDRQIVSKAWIDASTTPRLEATGPYFYGYLWWLGRSLHEGREIHWSAALGRGGQSIRIVPELDLVVAVTAGYYQDYSPRAFQLQSGIFKDVLRGNSVAGLNAKSRSVRSARRRRDQATPASRRCRNSRDSSPRRCRRRDRGRTAPCDCRASRPALNDPEKRLAVFPKIRLKQ